MKFITATGAVAQLAGDVAFWLVVILFLPAILAVLELDGLLNPVENMVTEILGFLPNLIGAAIILVVGWLVARVVRRLVTSVSVGVGVDSVSEKVGVAAALGENRLSNLLGLMGYALVFIPAFILALEALELLAFLQASKSFGGRRQLLPRRRRRVLT